MGEFGRKLECGVTSRRCGIGEAIEVRVVDRELIEHVRCVVRRQQIDLGAAQRRSKAYGEMIPITAKIDHVATLRQPHGKRCDIAEKAVHGDRLSGTPGEE